MPDEVMQRIFGATDSRAALCGSFCRSFIAYLRYARGDTTPQHMRRLDI
jgi:hypothetical protein